MAELLRLRRYKTHSVDGRSSVEYDTEKGFVQVALVLGNEPHKITDPTQYLDIDRVILDVADHIRRERKKDAKPRKNQRSL